MSPDESLFHREEQVLARARASLAEASGEAVDRGEVEALVAAFERLLRQTRRLTRVADRHQERLRGTSERLDTTLERQVGGEILKKELLRGGEVRTWDLTIMFVDIRGYTTLAESRQAEEVFHLLERYFRYLLTIIERHGGVVKNFMGDGVMVLFGVGGASGAADSAIRAAVELLEGLPALSVEMELDLEVGVGLHAGETAIGSLGSEARTVLTVIGNTVNVASRIEAATKEHGTALLFSGAVLDRLTDPPRRPVAVGQVILRGQAETISLHSLEGFGLGEGGGPSLGFDLLGHSRELERRHVVLAHRGPISQEMLIGIAETLRARLVEDKTDRRTAGRVFGVFIELAQNVLHHSGERLSAAEGIGLLVICDDVGSFRLLSGNVVDSTRARQLEGRCAEVNSLDAEGLKRLYKERIRRDRVGDEVGSGLGLIDMARRSGSPLASRLQPLGDGRFFFSLAIQIDRPAATE